MKKVLILSSLALILTGCANNTGSKNKSVISDEKTENVNNEVLIKKDSNSETENQDVFKEILNNPTKYFDTEVTDIKYSIKTGDTQYLLLSGKTVVEKGITQIKVFAYNKDKKSVEDTKEILATGVAGAGGFRGSIEEYINSSNKLRYITVSSGTGEYEIEDIILNANKVNRQRVGSGNMRNGGITKADTQEIAWNTIGSNIVEQKEEKKETSNNSLTKEQSEALANGMKVFGQKMNQVPYEKTDVPDRLTWQSGGDVSGYKIFESYIYKSGSVTHRYFFVTNASGNPEVLYSTGGTSVKHTANADIAAMFKGVYGGSESSTSSKDSNSSSSNKYTGTYKTKDNKTISIDENGNINLYNRLFVPKTNEGGIIGFADSTLPSNVTNATVVSLIPAGMTTKYAEQVKGKDDSTKDRIVVFTIGAAPDMTEIYFKEGSSTKESKPSKSSKLDLDAIAKGDFTSMQGTREGHNGGTWEITKNTISYKGRTEKIDSISKEGNVVKIKFPMAWFIVVPAGESKPHVQGWTGDGFYNDDQSRDRVYVFGNGVNLIFLD